MKTFIVIDLFRRATVRVTTTDEILIRCCPIMGETLAIEDSDGNMRPILVIAEEPDHPDFMEL